ncbi:MAG TPA: alpha/beta fold hydrolase [Mucilaginibacter sp.]|nr:alpha/beta fold hydrolase [Mucilaginibacter sp.]
MKQYIFKQTNVQIPAEEGIELGAWLFLPDASSPLPAITMAHGYAGSKYHGLQQFAELFASAGFVVLVHDHRGFGDSGGWPRQDVNPWQQVADWRRAVSYLETLPQVDANRIGIWGTSYAGGHALVLAATDRRLKAVVSQVPIISGIEQGKRRTSPDLLPALEAFLADDERSWFKGDPINYMFVVAEDKSQRAAYYGPEVIDFYLQPIPQHKWENKVTVRSTYWSRMYEPGTFISLISPTPLLMIVADEDRVTLTDVELAAYERALQPKQLKLINGGHFDPYLKQFDQAAGAALVWFDQHLNN